MEEFKQYAKKQLEQAEKQLHELEKMLKVLQASGQTAPDLVQQFYNLKRQLETWKQALKALEE